MVVDKVLIAIKNKGKIREFKKLFEDFDIKVLTLEDMPESIEVVEDRQTFLENALKKAKEYADFFKLPVITEDAGLEVYALNGYPGIYSARFYSIDFGGKEEVKENESKDNANIRKLLRLLKDKTNRKARFVSNIVFYIPDKYGVWTEGYLYGRIAEEPKGDRGFGYDPIFIPEGYSKTLGEFDIEEKNKISHRAKASYQLKKILNKLLKNNWLIMIGGRNVYCGWNKNNKKEKGTS